MNLCSTYHPSKSIKPLALAVLLLSGCQSNITKLDTPPGGEAVVSVHPSVQQLASEIDSSKLSGMSKKLAAEGIKILSQGKYEKAQALFNLALKTDINNSFLHFLNAHAYHLRALGGEGALFALAQQGYEMSIQFDPSNGIAQHYLGLLYLDRRQFTAAKDQLMEAALYNPNDADLLYDLAVAAYYAKDPRTAYAALLGAQSLSNNQASAKNLRALAIVAAAAGDKTAAESYLKQLAQSDHGNLKHPFARQRVDSWQEALNSKTFRAQYANWGNDGGGGWDSGNSGGSWDSGGGNYDSGAQNNGGWGDNNQAWNNDQTGTTPAISSVGADGFYEKNMVMLDVVIISTQEDNNDTIGINLLDGLRIQFGNTLGNPAWSRTDNIVSDLINPAFDTNTRTVTRLLQVPSINYTLNIANAVDRSNEVLARPSLVALGGQTSTFFSGTDVIGAAVSTGQGGSVQVQKEAGVKLALTPEFLPDDLIKMKVVAERTFLTNPNSNVLFDFRLDTSKTLVSANVAMKYGETLILSGLSERNVESTNDGVPLLRDIPIAQYLFSRKTDRDFFKSVLILVTPRRPTYTHRAQADIDADRAEMSDLEKVNIEFEDKFKDWFKNVPTTAQVISSLESSPLFREFRSGDLEIESWTSRVSHAGRLKAAMKYLYY